MPIWAHALVPQTKLAFRDEMDEILKKQQDAFDFIIGSQNATTGTVRFAHRIGTRNQGENFELPLNFTIVAVTDFPV